MTTMLVPVGIAYAEASGVPGINGLYATIVPLIAYALFGPSRIIVLGPDSALATVILGVVAPLSAGDPRRAVALAGAMAIVNYQQRKEIEKRAAVLDPMTIEQLRTEVDCEKASFRVNPDNTTEIKIEPPKTGIFADKMVEPNIIGRVRFTHDPTGKWAMMLLTKPDARATIKYFRKVFGRNDVEVELRIKKDRAEGV